jgi:2-polyprenyl-6-hydroxyphenyl methylase / 3-demethylubiquinone-9 3-methyltransferase
MERKTGLVNNDFYDDLHEAWKEGIHHPIALLRSENTVRNPWIQNIIHDHFSSSVSVLDIGCGGGLLTSYLNMQGHKVTGIDLSQGSLDFAKKQDLASKINYVYASADSLPFEDSSFDVVCAMDLLEHVDDYKKVISEASRVLKPGGLMFFHTFNRNALSYIMIIKGVEWFVKNTPQNMHHYDHFIKPKELKSCLEQYGLKTSLIQGLVPDPLSKGFWKMLLRKTVDDSFRFKFIKNTFTGYVGFAQKL